MTVELVCPSCGRQLRIAAEHAGKQIRCPACQQVSTSPVPLGLSSQPASSIAAQDSANLTLWHVRTPEGAVYGPIHWQAVLDWAEEGRIADDCELSQASDGPWQPAANLISGLGSSVLSVPGAAAAPAATPAPSPPFSPPWSSPGTAGGPVAPHRGPVVLIMGILGFFIGCPVFSVVAWMLGSRDLREMRAGRMDRSGETMTLVGMILGIVLTLFWVVVAFIVLTVLLLAFAMQF